MTHYQRQLSVPRTASAPQPSTRHPATRHVSIRPPAIKQGFAAAAPTGIAAARSSTALVLSMMVALRYLEGRTDRPAHIAADALSAPAIL